jgi:transcriptional regulator with XRE-family HTH domain
VGTVRTPKGRALGRALRQVRTERGLTLKALGDKIGRDPAVLSRWETGDRRPKPEDVAQVLGALGVNGERYEEIMTLTGGTDERMWVAITLPEQRQHLAALLDCEQTANNITTVSPLLVPGLLQTSGYVRALMSGSDVPADEVATRITIRLGRRDVLTRTDPPPVRLLALIGEAALRHMIGGRDVMIGQLRHLLDMGERPNIDIQVIPFGSGWNPALEGPFMLLDSDDMPVVHLETRRSGLFLHEEDDVSAYRQAVDMVLPEAMSADNSAAFIAEQINRLESTQDE